VYDENYDPVVLKEWAREMEKSFIVVEVPEEKKVNIGTCYFIGEANIYGTLLTVGLWGLNSPKVNS